MLLYTHSVIKKKKKHDQILVYFMLISPLPTQTGYYLQLFMKQNISPCLNITCRKNNATDDGCYWGLKQQYIFNQVINISYTQ